MNYLSIISPEKTPGSAGGLTEFDSSGNMSLRLASAVQIGCPCHDEYLPRLHHLSEIGGLDFNRLRSGPFEGPAIVIPPPLPEDTYSMRGCHKN